MHFSTLDYLHAIKQLLNIWRTTPVSANQQELVAYTVIMPEVVAHFIPHERSLVLEAPGINLAPLAPKIAIESCRLHDFHGDPADRIIIATARIEELTLITMPSIS